MSVCVSYPLVAFVGDTCQLLACSKCGNIPHTPMTNEDGEIFCGQCTRSLEMNDCNPNTQVQKMIGNLTVKCLNNFSFRTEAQESVAVVAVAHRGEEEEEDNKNEAVVDDASPEGMNNIQNTGNHNSITAVAKKQTHAHSECDWIGKLKSWKNHNLSDCKWKLQCCEYAKYGCKQTNLLRMKMKQHLEDEQINHLNMTLTFVISENEGLKQRILQLEESEKLQSKKVVLLETNVKSLDLEKEELEQSLMQRIERIEARFQCDVIDIAKEYPECAYNIPIVFKARVVNKTTLFLGCEKYELLNDNTRIRFHSPYVFMAEDNTWNRVYGGGQTNAYGIRAGKHLSFIMRLAYVGLCDSDGSSDYGEHYPQTAKSKLKQMYYNGDSGSVETPGLKLTYLVIGQQIYDLPWFECDSPPLKTIRIQ